MILSSTIISLSANAQDIESLVMPGDVIEGHADIQSECSSCHKKFDKQAQRSLCMDCHEEVAEDIQVLAGFHGLFDDARDSQCATCHTDHEGRDADIVALDESTFDHQLTDFELIGAHREVDCSDCHTPDSKHREASNSCKDCHGDDDAHDGFMGTDCGECHKPTEWPDAEFDHSSTGYPLIGEHMEPACGDCHADATYQNAPTACIDCHAEDDAHDGRSGQQCDTCHNPKGWSDTSFDHARDTDFILDGKHGLLTCGDCHSENPFEDEMDSACVACHLEEDSHDKHNGAQCDTCHASDDWAKPFFDHDRDTEYHLLGGHREVACTDCHVEPIFDASLNTSCDSCHLDDDPHDGSLGTQCENCHTEVNWQDPVFFDHDFTGFPLLGMHRENECEDCHATKAFGETDINCVACHREQDPHRGNFHDRCDTCHNPVAWDLWLFDHDEQTQFSLTGAHVEVGCADCHRTPLGRFNASTDNCRNCHRADDIHDGEFGYDCGRCHTATSFSEVRSLQ
jgi:hypothetical protein